MLNFLRRIFEWSIFAILTLLTLVVISPLLPTKKYISTFVISSGSMEPKLQSGGVAFIKPVNPNQIQKGDIIAFLSPKDQKITILHRVFKTIKIKNTLSFETKGDNNDASDNWRVSPANIIGKCFFSIPFLGTITIFVKQPLGYILIIGIPALILIFFLIKSIKEGIDEEVEKKTKKALENLKNN